MRQENNAPKSAFIQHILRQSNSKHSCNVINIFNGSSIAAININSNSENKRFINLNHLSASFIILDNEVKVFHNGKYMQSMQIHISAKISVFNILENAQGNYAIVEYYHHRLIAHKINAQCKALLNNTIFTIECNSTINQNNLVVSNMCVCNEYTAFTWESQLWVISAKSEMHYVLNPKLVYNIAIKEDSPILIDSNHNQFILYPLICGIPNKSDSICKNYLSLLKYQMSDAKNNSSIINELTYSNYSIPLILLYCNSMKLKEEIIKYIISHIDLLSAPSYAQSIFMDDILKSQTSKVFVIALHLLCVESNYNYILKLYEGMSKICQACNLVNMSVIAYKFLSSLPTIKCFEEGINNLAQLNEKLPSLYNKLTDLSVVVFYLLLESNEYGKITTLMTNVSSKEFKMILLKNYVAWLNDVKPKIVNAVITQMIFTGITIKDIMN